LDPPIADSQWPIRVSSSTYEEDNTMTHGNDDVVLRTVEAFAWVHYGLQNTYFCPEFIGLKPEEKQYSTLFRAVGNNPRTGAEGALNHAKEAGWDVSDIPNDLPEVPRVSSDWDGDDDYYFLTLCLR
jgi:hypothetical protein